MKYGKIKMNGEPMLINLSEVCAITEEYIQFDGGHVIYGNIDVYDALANLLEVMVVTRKEREECTTHT